LGGDFGGHVVGDDVRLNNDSGDGSGVGVGAYGGVRSNLAKVIPEQRRGGH